MSSLSISRCLQQELYQWRGWSPLSTHR